MKDRKIYCLDNISHVGTAAFREGYELTDNVDEAAGIIKHFRVDKMMKIGLTEKARVGQEAFFK